MRKIHLAYLTFFFTLLSISQNGKIIAGLENKNRLFELKIEALKDSIAKINLKIAKIKSEKLRNKVKDSSLTAIAIKGAKLKKKPEIFTDVIIVFDDEKKIIILDYVDGYFEVCQDSLCGYMSEIWVKKSNLVSEFINSIESKSKYISKQNYSNSIERTKVYYTSRRYYRGSKGGCYYINSNGNKTYVERSLCN